MTSFTATAVMILLSVVPATIIWPVVTVKMYICSQRASVMMRLTLWQRTAKKTLLNLMKQLCPLMFLSADRTLT